MRNVRGSLIAALILGLVLTPISSSLNEAHAQDDEGGLTQSQLLQFAVVGGAVAIVAGLYVCRSRQAKAEAARKEEERLAREAEVKRLSELNTTANKSLTGLTITLDPEVPVAPGRTIAMSVTALVKGGPDLNTKGFGGGETNWDEFEVSCDSGRG